MIETEPTPSSPVAKSSAIPATQANLAPRTVSESQSEMTELILPNDTNTLGNLLGGRLMHFIDLVGAMAAYRHTRTHVVTAAMDHIDFIQPVHVGDLLILKSSVNRAFSKSVEVGVKVWTENTQAGLIGTSPALIWFSWPSTDRQSRSRSRTVPETADEHAPLRRRAAPPREPRSGIRAPRNRPASPAAPPRAGKRLGR